MFVYTNQLQETNASIVKCSGKPTGYLGRLGNNSHTLPAQREGRREGGWSGGGKEREGMLSCVVGI